MRCASCRNEIADASIFCPQCGFRQADASAGIPPRQRRLRRSISDRQITGLCGGVAEYVDIDPTVVRLFTVITIVFTAIVPGILAYFVASFIVPSAPGD